jgi:hypothetical protein
MLIKNTPKTYNKQGTKKISPNKIGNNTVQQKDINWSNLILGNEALTQIKINTIIELFTPKVILDNNPLNEILSKYSSLIKL